MTGNQIGDEGAKAISELLKTNSSLNEMLKVNTTLTNLYLHSE